MDLTTITVDQFKVKFYRDFKFSNLQTPVPLDPPAAPPDEDTVQDGDIQAAYSDAQGLLNQALFPNTTAIVTGYLLLAAHCLCLAIRSAGAGLNGGGSNFPVQARTVGSVSESYQVPEAYLKSPILSQYTQTSYGLRYLQMVQPYLVGNMRAVWGGAQP